MPRRTRRTTAVLTGTAAAAMIALAACGSSGTPAATPHTTATAAAAAHPSAASPSPTGCNLTTTFDYIVRDDWPGTGTTAQEIGNVNLATCSDSVQFVIKTAGQAAGECTTIAKASDNPGYDVNADPAPRLHKVIASAGPGC